FKVFESETLYDASEGGASASFVLNPVYDKDGFDARAVYSIADLRTAIRERKLKSRIEMVTDNTYGDGSANDAYIYLLSKDGTVRGSVVLMLAGGDYYAE